MTISIFTFGTLIVIYYILYFLNHSFCNWHSFISFCLCIFKWVEILNIFLQKCHTNFSLVWLISCVVNKLGWQKFFWQRLHLNIYFPVNSGDVLNAFWQKGHGNGFSPLWLLLCVVKSPDCLNAFWQKGHRNGFFQYGWVYVQLIHEMF